MTKKTHQFVLVKRRKTYLLILSPGKKRRPRSANSLLQESLRQAADQHHNVMDQDSKVQSVSRSPSWRSRLRSAPFQSSPSIACDKLMDTQVKSAKEATALQSRSCASDQWDRQFLDLAPTRTEQLTEKQQTLVVPQELLPHHPPPVIHYHINIQNCDGLNIHVNNPDCPNSDFALSIDQTTDQESTLEWGEPLASSTLRKESLALHNQLESNTSDEESISDSMAPLNLDETCSDINVTGDTTALMDMDAWGGVQDSQNSIQFEKIHQQLAMADGLGSRNKPVRLSQRAQGVPIPPSPQPFNPPWRQTSRSDTSQRYSSAK